MNRPGDRDPNLPERRDWRTRPARHLVDDVRPAIRSTSPVDLLMLASAVVEAATTAGSDASELDLDTFVGWLARIDGLRPRLPELVALATAMRPLVSGQPWLLGRLAEVIADGPDTGSEPMLPDWLDRLDQLSVTDVVSIASDGGQARTVVVGVCWPVDLAGVVTIALGPAPDGLDAIRPGTPIVLDALAAPLPISALLDHYRSSIPGSSFETASWSHAREQLASALRHGRLVDAALDHPATSTETWPLARPFLSWLIECPG